MASVLPAPTPLLPRSSASSSSPSPSPSPSYASSSALRSNHSKRAPGQAVLQCRQQRRWNRTFVRRPELEDLLPAVVPDLTDVASLKLKLLSAVSGLNRGLATDEEDLRMAESAAKELESVGGLVDLSCDLDKLQGRWKLIYSSAFSSRTLGGSRPGPPTGRLLPINLGKVFQRIDVLSKDFDNIVELEFGSPWPLPTAEATATLAHKFELMGSSKIKITFINTTVKPTGNLSQIPPVELPRLPDGLRPPSNTATGSGEFEVTYLDADTRITRGDRGELRVFVIS